MTETLSGNHDVGKVDMVDRLNRQLAGWAALYKFNDFTARTFRHIDTIVFWKLAHWLARKYRSPIKPSMQRCIEAGKAKTWLVYGSRRARVECIQSQDAVPVAEPGDHPYIFWSEIRNTIPSRYHDVAMAMGQG
ncbi:hypothetical protein NKH48_27735 [Mesorhizobium sp. M1233]